MKNKVFTIGKYQAVVSIRDNGNEQQYYHLSCVLTYIPTNTEKYVIEHKTVNGLCYQLHKYMLLECEDIDASIDAGMLFFGVESIRDWLDFKLSNAEVFVSNNLDDVDKDWLFK